MYCFVPIPTKDDDERFYGKLSWIAKKTKKTVHRIAKKRKE